MSILITLKAIFYFLFEAFPAFATRFFENQFCGGGGAAAAKLILEKSSNMPLNQG